jgi:hypothetical protein
MALAGVTLRTTNPSGKLTIAQVDGNFSAITSSLETATANVVTINNRVSASLRAFPNISTWDNTSGIQTSGSLIVSGGSVPFENANLQVYGNTALSGSLILTGSATSVGGLNFVDDTAAASGGVPVGGMYHNAGAVRIRLT